jgi:hypothetical protein
MKGGNVGLGQGCRLQSAERAAKLFEGDSVAYYGPRLQHRSDVLGVEEVDQFADCHRGATLQLLPRRVSTKPDSG